MESIQSYDNIESKKKSHCMLFIVTLKVIIIKNKILVKTFLKMLFGGLNFFLSNRFTFFPPWGKMQSSII